MFGEATEYQPAYKMSEPDEAKFASIMANADGDPKVAFDYWLRWKILTDLFFFGNEVMGWRYACSKRNYPEENRRRYRVDPDLHRWLAAILQQEENMLRDMVNKVKDAGANVLFCQKGMYFCPVPGS